MSESQIAALLHERERHVLADNKERIADIDAELAALGHKAGRVVDEIRTTAAPRASKAT